MGSWQGVHPAMGLGEIQPVHPAIPVPDGLVFEEERETVAPQPGTALRAGGMRLQSATPEIRPDIRKPDLPRGGCPETVLGERSAGPPDDLDMRTLACGLPLGKRQEEWNAQQATHIPPDPELQRSTEPRRIWNRVYLGLTLAELGKSVARATAGIQNTNLLRPVSSGLLPDPDRRPVGARPVQREAMGFPIPHEMTLELARYIPPPAIHAPLQIGPRAKVSMPSLPTMSIVSQ
jgi:hypothetical protein